MQIEVEPILNTGNCKFSNELQLWKIDVFTKTFERLKFDISKYFKEEQPLKVDSI